MADDDAGTSPAGEGRRPAFPTAAGDAPGPVPGTDGRATARAATPRGTGTDASYGPRRLPAVLGATGAGLTAAVLGTLLHGQLLSIGTVALPVGALGALVLAGSLFLLSGLWARNVVLTAVAGVVAYGVVALLSTSPETLILTGSSETAPGPALAGNLWLFGVLAVTLAAVAVCAVVLARSRVYQRTAPAPQEAGIAGAAGRADR